MIQTLKKLPKNLFNYKISSQLIGSGSSIGANYVEANGAESKKDFIHKIRISLKESRETRYWLSILVAINAEFKKELSDLWRESNEFVMIFAKIISNSQ